MVKLAQIQSIQDVKTFVAQLVQEGTNFHPDNYDFKEYITETGESVYSPEEILLRNTLLRQSFSVCKQKNKCIYNLCLEVFLKETGMQKIIPLPSAILKN